MNILIMLKKKTKSYLYNGEDEIESAYNYLKDEDFMKELQRRASELETDAKKGVSWDTVKRKTIKALHSA